MAVLSRSKISSFCGDVVPLYFDFGLRGTNTLAAADIKWSCEGDAVSLRTFSGEDEMSFNNGVLVILKKVGSALVKANFEGREYTCDVEVTELHHSRSDDELGYYFGDFHDHTTHIHNREKCMHREDEFQVDYVRQVREEGLMDVSVVSDHAGVINDTDFFRGFVADDLVEPKDVLILSGAESEIGYTQYDRFGIKHRLSGEIVTLNAAGYIDTEDWGEFESTLETSPEPVCIFAHPIISGFSTPGLWNFDFANRTSAEMKRVMRGVELGTGIDEDECLVYEYAYSDALDAGFRVSTTCSSDSHGPRWGYYQIPGKTVIRAREKSKEAFIDALRHNRFYATESGNVRLNYTVNGMSAPCELPLTDSYSFHVELSSFREDKSTEPVVCRVISDGGRTLKIIENITSDFSFEVRSDSAHYFYLRFSDSIGRRTWSMPVWTGRPFEKKPAAELVAISPDRLCAIDRFGGKDARAAVDGNPRNHWVGDSKLASVLIDMGECREIKALGFCQRILERVSRRIAPNWRSTDYTPGFPVEYEIYTSEDGVNYKMCADGCLRAFGAEEIVEFSKHSARYVRFDVTSTVATYCGFDKYAKAPVSIGNITLFE